MAANYDQVALTWVKDEISNTLEQARQSLESYFEDTDDQLQIRYCMNCLHQVQGTLLMLEIVGGAMLAEEMENLAREISSSTSEINETRFEALMRAILQLPTYLERLQAGQDDDPIVLLPMLNELRVQRGLPEMLESQFFHVDLEISREAGAKEVELPEDFNLSDEVAKLRQQFQKALLGVIKNTNIEDSFQLIHTVLENIEMYTATDTMGKFWWVASGFAHAVEADKSYIDKEVKGILGKLDRQIKNIVENTLEAVSKEPPEYLLNKMLYFVAQSNCSHERVAELKVQFDLDDQTIHQSKVAVERIKLTGPDQNVMASVVKVLKEDLTTIKETLDLFVRSTERDISELEDILPSLQQIADTLVMLELESVAKVVNDQISAIRETVGSGESPSDELIIDIAGALLFIDASLTSKTNMAMQEALEGREDDASAIAKEVAFDESRKLIIVESRISLQKAKDAIIEFITNDWDHHLLEEVPVRLTEARGAINIIGLEHPADLLKSCHEYLKTKVLVEKIIPTESVLDALADVLTSIDYYLEGMESGARTGLQSVLDAADESIVIIREQIADVEKIVEPEQFDTESEVPSEYRDPNDVLSDTKETDESLIDDEVVEIFLEEAEEVLETLTEHLPQWINNSDNHKSLTIARRSFHTLKGSGRMVGAQDIGELAWSVEDLLNKVLEGSQKPHSDIFQVVSFTQSCLPTLIEDFREQRNSSIAINLIIERADQLARGEGYNEDWTPPSESTAEVAEQPDSVQVDELETEAQDIADEYEIVEVEQPEVELLDLELIEIFSTEAEEHIATINQYLDESVDSPLTPKPNDQLLRALHTLKGSARMAGILLLGDMIAPVEGYFRELKLRNLHLNEESLEHLKAFSDYLLKGIPEVLAQCFENENDEQRQALTQRTETLFDELPPLDVHIEEDTDIQRNPETVTNLLRISNEILMTASENVAQWNDLEKLHVGCSELSQELNTIVELAELAQEDIVALTAIDRREFTEKLSTLAMNKELATEAQALVAECIDQLLDMLDIIAADQDVPESDELKSEISHLFTKIGLAPKEDDELIIEEDLTSEPFIERRSVNQEVDPTITLSDDLIFGNEEEYITGLSIFPNEETDLGLEIEDTDDDLEKLDVQQSIGPDLHTELDEFIIEEEDEFLPPPPQMDELQTYDDKEEEISLELEDDSEDEISLELEDDTEDEISLELEDDSDDEINLELEDDSDDEISLELEDDSENEVDPEIVEIALEEAEEILERTQILLEEWKQNPSNTENVAVLQRELHTLKGSSRMAGITALGDFSHHLEDIYEAISEGKAVASSQLIDLCIESQDLLQDMVEACLESKDLPDATNLIAKIDASVSGEVEEAEEELARFIPVDLDDDGEEILDIFMEEAREILDSLDETIIQWKADTGNKEHVALMQRNLHTLKGGARLSELNLLGDLSHHLETIYEGVVEGRRAVEDPLFQLSLDARDAFSALINEIDEHRRMTPPQEFIALLEKEIGETIVINYPEAEVDSTENIEEPIAAVEETPKEEKIKGHDLDLPPLDQAMPFVPIASQQPAPVVKKKAAKTKNTGEQVKIGADTLEDLVNLAGESSILRSRMEQQVNTLRYNLDEMNSTIDRLRSQLRAMEIETDAQIQYRQEVVGPDAEEFDPLEMDRYSRQQELTRGLSESSNDLLNLQDNFDHLTSETEVLLLQQGRINTELQERLIDTRMIPFDSLVPRLQRMVRQIGKELDKTVEISIHADGEMDRTVLEKMISPIEHMLRNAIDHGIESPDVREKQGKKKQGRIKIRLTREGAQVVISISDDGAGIDLEAVREKALEREIISSEKELSDKELIKLIFSAGFSTAEKVTQISGRGVGMDVVFNQIKQLGGYVDVESVVGEGSQFIVRLPFTVSVNNALMVTVKDEPYAVPLTNIEGIVTVSPYELEELYKLDKPVYEYAGISYELNYLGTLLEHEKTADFEGIIKSVPVLLLHGVDRPVAVQLDGLIGSREVVVKSLGAQLSSIGGLSGATILGDGSVVLILDIPSLWRRLLASDGEELVETETLYEEDYVPTVMVVDDSITVRKVTTRLLERNHFNVITAKDGVDAASQLQEVHPDIILLDIEMPKMDGFELASIIRSESDLKDIPIIMITSRTGEKHKERAMSLGVNDYMGKPFGEAKLLSRIGALIDLDGKD